MEDRILIEVCVDSLESAIAGEMGGADRLELNLALELDGLTPSMGLFKAVRQAVSIPIIVMIRPRANGFVYSDKEFATMQADIDAFLEAGIDGVATGFLTPNFEIDRKKALNIANQLGQKEFVFHRAFDVTPNANAALETLVECGVQRVLTSGQQPTAIAGIQTLQELIKEAGDSIEILPGAGVKPSNVADLVLQTGCKQIHGTFRKPNSNSKTYEGFDVLRAPGLMGTDQSLVAEVRRIVDSL